MILKWLPLDKRDSVFFSIIGCVSALGLHISDKIDIPAHMDGNYFQSLLLDHVPIRSIYTLWIVATLLSLFCVAILNNIKMLSEQSQHLSNKLSQFVSPAFFVLIGFGLTLSVLYFFEDDIEYIQVSCSVISFAVFLVVMCSISNFLSDTAKEKSSPKIRKFCTILMISICFSLLLNIMAKSKPKEVVVSFELSQYKMIKAAAKAENLTIKSFIHQASMSRLNTHLRELNGN